MITVSSKIQDKLEKAGFIPEDYILSKEIDDDFLIKVWFDEKRKEALK